MSVIVTPPVWRSPFAYGIYTIVLVIIGLVVYRNQKKKALNRKQIRESEQRLKMALWGSDTGYWDWDLSSKTILHSKNATPTRSASSAESTEMAALVSRIHPRDMDRISEALVRHFKQADEHFEASFRLQEPLSGQWCWQLVRGRAVERDSNDRVMRMAGTVKDITDVKSTEEQLELLARSMRATSDGMVVLDPHFRVVEANPALSTMIGTSRDALINQHFMLATQEPVQWARLADHLASSGSWQGEYELHSEMLGTRYLELTTDTLRDEDGDVSHYVVVMSDITARKKSEAEIRRLASTDSLTGLPNRNLFQAALDAALARGKSVGVLLADLDRFKTINDSLGHQQGDQLLIMVAQRLQDCLKPYEALYRLGGDEFAVFVDRPATADEMRHLVERLNASMATPFVLASQEYVISLSAGLVLAPQDGECSEQILRSADIAMYRSKQEGRGGFRFSQAELNNQAERHLEIEQDLRIAIAENQLTLAYQPKVELENGQIVGMEALVRWIHPEKGFISPGEFIPVAEDSGLIVEIGEKVLQMACDQAAQWYRAGQLPGRMAVNLSPQQFKSTGLLSTIERTLKQTGLPPQMLDLEITESSVMTEPDAAIEIMETLKDFGVSWSIDDFGTGYSSLAYLKRFPVSCLKIDRAFVNDLVESESDRGIASAIVGIAEHLGMHVVAEGIEHLEQGQILKQMGCQQAQGFYYFRPLPAADLGQILTKQFDAGGTRENHRQASRLPDVLAME